MFLAGHDGLSSLLLAGVRFESADDGQLPCSDQVKLREEVPGVWIITKARSCIQLAVVMNGHGVVLRGHAGFERLSSKERC